MLGAATGAVLAGLACLLVSVSIVSRVTAFVASLVASMATLLIAQETIPTQLGMIGSFFLGLLPPLGASVVALVWGARQGR